MLSMVETRHNDQLIHQIVVTGEIFWESTTGKANNQRSNKIFKLILGFC